MLSKHSVKKPFTVIVGVIIVIILGVVSYLNMGVDLLPSMNLPYIAVVTISPGSPPEEVEQLVTRPVEDSLSKVANINEITSTSYEHFSLVLLEFNYDADVDRAYSDVQAALDLVALPDNDLIQEPIVMRINPTMLPIMSVSISRKGHSIKESNAYLTNIMEQINALEGVASVSANGFITNMAYINVKEEKIAVSLLDFIENALGFRLQIPLAIKEEIRASLSQAVSLENITTEDIIDRIIEVLRNAQWEDSVQGNLLNTLTDILIINLEDPNSIIYGRVAESVDEILANKFILNDDDESKRVFYDFLDQITKNIIIQVVNEQLGGMADMISPDILGQLLYAQDFEMPSGSLQQGAVSYIVKIGTGVTTRDELIDLPVVSFDLSAEIALRTEQIQSILTLLSIASEGEVTFTQSQLESLCNAIYEAYSQAQDTTSPFTEIFLEYIKDLDPDVAASLEELFQERSAEEIESYIRSFLSLMSIFSPEGVIIPQPDNDVIPPNAQYTINFPAIKESILALEERAVVPLTLGSISDIIFLDDSIEQITTLLTRIDGELIPAGAVNLTIDKESDKSSAEVTRSIQEFLQDYQKKDSEFQYTILINEGDYIDFMLNNVIENLIYGGLLAVLILFIFLRNIKATLVVGSSIIISVIATFVMMYFAGITLNVVSMGGLALGVGMLVDNSIIVIENIFRMRGQGKNIFVASIQGAKQVTSAIVASTLTTVIVFLPIAFIEGLTKQIFTDMALTITFSLLASLVVALTLVPMSTSTFIKKPAKQDTKVFLKIKKAYAKTLNFALNHKAIAFIVMVVLFAGSVLMVLNMDNELFPPMDSGTLSITASIDRVAIDRYNAEKPLDEPYLTYDDVEQMIIDEIVNETKKYPEIKSVGIAYSGGLKLAGFSLGGNNIAVNIMMVNEKQRDFGSLALAEKMKKNLNDFSRTGGLYTFSFSTNEMGGVDIIGGDQTIKLYGRDLDLMRKEAQKIKDLLTKKDKNGNIITDSKGEPVFIDGIANVDFGDDIRVQEYRIKVDKEKANRYGLTVAQVFLQIQAALSEAGVSHTLSLINENDTTTDYDVYIYTSDFTVNGWYVCTDENGAEIPVNVVNNRASEQEDSSKNEYFIRNPYNKGIYVWHNQTNLYIAKGGRVPVIKDGDTFKYFLINEGESGLKYSQKIFKITSNSVNYKVERVKEFDLMTMNISSENLFDPSSPVMSVPLYRLLDSDCFLKDESGKILYRENTVERIPLGLVTSDGYDSIYRENRRRAESISIRFASGVNSNEMIKKVSSIIEKEYQVPDELILDMSQGNKYINEVFNTLYLVLGLSVVLIYLVMVAQFQSLKSPFIIMITLPLAFTGSIFALALADLSLSVMAMIGLIVLMGIVVNNGIVFVDYCNQLIESNVPKRMALLRTGMDRLRPILMTAMTTIFGLLIMAADSSEGGVMLKPLAIATIGGLSFATVLTLFFVPMFYDVINRKIKQTDRHRAFLDKDIDLISTTEVEDMLNQTSDNFLDDIVSSSELGEAVAAINKDIEDVKPRQTKRGRNRVSLTAIKKQLRYQKKSKK